MNKSFVRELVITNYIIIGFLVTITIVANLYYGGSAAVWSRALGLVAILALALVLKMKRIKSKGDNLDERLQLITYRSITIGYYFMLGVIWWYYTKEMAIYGEVSTRTIVEVLAGMLGYLGSFIFLNKKY
jgi:hypothetical protein